MSLVYLEQETYFFLLKIILCIFSFLVNTILQTIINFLFIFGISLLSIHCTLVRCWDFPSLKMTSPNRDLMGTSCLYHLYAITVINHVTKSIQSRENTFSFLPIEYDVGCGVFLV